MTPISKWGVTATAGAIVLAAGAWMIISRPSSGPAPRQPGVPIVSGPTIRASTPSGTGDSQVTAGSAGPGRFDPDRRRGDQRKVSEDVLPLLNRISPDMRLLHERLMSERRDESWAGQAEATLRTRLEDLKGIGEAGRPIDVFCGATVCEISGSLEDLPGGKGGDVMKAVQSNQLVEAMAALGFRQQGAAFGSGGRTPDMFVTYYTRAKPEIITL